jgi:hypothetical protein
MVYSRISRRCLSVASLVFCRQFPYTRPGRGVIRIWPSFGRNWSARAGSAWSRGAYFVQSEMTLPRGQSVDWLIVADVNQGPSDVARLRRELRRPARVRREVLKDIQQGTQELRRLAASADGLQQTARPPGCARHFSNVLFNIMRGGVFADGYDLAARDLRAFVRNANRALAVRHAAFFRRLPQTLRHRDLVAAAVAAGDPQLERVSVTSISPGSSAPFRCRRARSPSPIARPPSCTGSRRGRRSWRLGWMASGGRAKHCGCLRPSAATFSSARGGSRALKFPSRSDRPAIPQSIPLPSRGGRASPAPAAEPPTRRPGVTPPRRLLCRSGCEILRSWNQPSRN